jgi:cell division septation protein DedD
MIGVILAVVGGFLAVLLRGGVNPRENLSSPAETPTATPSNQARAPVAPKSPAPPSTQTPPQIDLAAPQIPTAPEESAPTRAEPRAMIAASVPNSPIAKTVAVTPKKTQAEAAPQTKRTGQYSRSDFLRSYRIAAGTYSSQTRAERAATALRKRGFPAQAFSSGKGYVVVVGPYTKEAGARSAATQLNSSSAILYRPNGSRETIAKKANVPKSGGGASGLKPQLATAKNSYLQVGAFRDTKSASPLLSKLKQAGFKAIVKGSIDGVARVIVGPVRSTDLERIKTNLRAQGLTPFNTTL